MNSIELENAVWDLINREMDGFLPDQAVAFLEKLSEDADAKADVMEGKAPDDEEAETNQQSAIGYNLEQIAKYTGRRAAR